jgi:hypothetical protein
MCLYLVHNIDQNDLNKILSDSKLKSSSKTKNVRMYGHSSGSKYIFLRLSQKNDYGNLYLDSKLLLENVFYLHTGWHGEPVSEMIDGRKLNIEQLNEILNGFKKNIQKYYKNQIKKNIPIPLMMSNEILVKNNIDLKKYLIKINMSKFNKKISEYVEKNYPNTQIIYPK